MQGWADPPLSAAGAEQAAVLGRRLGAEGPGAVTGVVSSDLGRARETAAILAGECGCPGPRPDARLREREIGWITGLTDEEARDRYPAEVAAWREQRESRPPGGESTESVLRRAHAALDALVAAGTGKGAAGAVGEAGTGEGAAGGVGEAVGVGAAGGGVVVAVSHGGLISALEREAGLGAGGFSNLTGRWVVPGGPARWQMGERFG